MQEIDGSLTQDDGTARLCGFRFSWHQAVTINVIQGALDTELTLNQVHGTPLQTANFGTAHTSAYSEAEYITIDKLVAQA